MSLWTSFAPLRGASEGAALEPADAIDPYRFSRREPTPLALGGGADVGPERPPRVVVRVGSVGAVAAAMRDLASPRLKETPAEGLLVPVGSALELAELRTVLGGNPVTAGFLGLETGPGLDAADADAFLGSCGARVLVVRRFDDGGGPGCAELAEWTRLVRRTAHFLAVDAAPDTLARLAPTLEALGCDNLVFTFSGWREAPEGHALGAYRRLAEVLQGIRSRAPIWIRNTAATSIRGDNSFLSRLLEASFLTGGLLCDGVGDLVSIETEPDPARSARLAYNVLQGAGARVSKTEFVACPSCGRTLFDLQTTTQRIRAQTGHLKGVKIAIMGCIVNGPGEMADADFGYVGGAPGRINLYVGRQCVQYNIPQDDADARLVALIKERGKWREPEPAHA